MPVVDSEIVQKNLYGIGISPLSISNKDHALPEEMMANKEIGLFYINSKEGDYALSAEYIARCKLHLDYFIKQCVHENTLGKIYKIFIDNSGTPTVNVSKNLFVNKVRYYLGDEKVKAFRINIDADLICKPRGIAIDPRDIKFKIQFSLAKGNDTADIKNYYIEESYEDINAKAFAIDMDSLTGEGEYTFTLNTFQVIVPESFDSSIHTIVVYDVLLALI